jgi:membrane-bound lytic murein transglycosylase D
MYPRHLYAALIGALLLLCLTAQAQETLSVDPPKVSLEQLTPTGTVDPTRPDQPPPAGEAASDQSAFTPIAEQEQSAAEIEGPPPAVDLTMPADDLWQRIRNGFGMPDLHSSLVTERQAWYLNHPDYLNQVIARSSKYLYYIVAELEQRGMPTELALLPMMESAFNPMALSRARALGMWQFIPSTGKYFKLEQNFWRDERRDVIASTRAALDYLESIYEVHGDWHLTLASYNWGEFAVAHAIAQNKAQGLPTDYESLSMPKETQYYVPTLQALKNIIAQPEAFGFDLAVLPNHPYFDTVPLSDDMDVAIAAKLAEMPVDEFIALNPAYHRPVIRGDSTTQLVLPTDRIQVFQTNLQRYKDQDKPLIHWHTHTLKKGEGLDRVAAQHGISLATLKQINSISPRTPVKPGFSLLVPDPDAQVTDQLAAALPKIPAEGHTSVRWHGKRKTVRHGKPRAQPASRLVKH